MNAAEALHLAEENGVRLGVVGADLILDADREPAPKVLDAIRHHKADIIALLTTPEDDRTAESRVTRPKAENTKEPAANRARLPKLPKLPTKTEHPNSAAGGTWDAETNSLIQWFLNTEPSSGPFQLQQAVYIAHPDRYWEYLRQDIAAGPNRARGRTGAFQENLRRLYRISHDGEDIGGGTT